MTEVGFMSDFTIEIVDPNDFSWSTEVDKIRTLLGAPHNEFLFPPHFIKRVFPKLGCKLFIFKKEDRFLGVGFLFPRNYQNGRCEFTVWAPLHESIHLIIFTNQKHIITMDKYDQGYFSVITDET